ncbi:hypothetical protein NDU88_003764 [Pleurodeles waltl]|uniref:Uncharacterized protein n=1 Tax=Pleurodeles waltl TaxID=8319 RepID=A0AAV7UDF6_PLEWA|nr:hypothetical protein NDU88_003764 [Pleurodeles waltl]
MLLLALGIPIHGLVTSIVTVGALPSAKGCSLCVSCKPTVVLLLPLAKCILCLFPPAFCFVTLSLCALASSGGGAEAPVTEGAASHRAQEAESTDGEGTSGTEGEESTTAETGGDSLDSDTSSDRSSLLVLDTYVPTPTTDTAATPRASTALPAAPQRVSRDCSPRRVGTAFTPGTSGPAPASPAALSEEAIDLLRSISVGQSTIANAIQGLAGHLQQTNAFLEGIDSGMAAQQRSIQALASSLMAAIVPVSSLPLPTSSTQSHSS